MSSKFRGFEVPSEQCVDMAEVLMHGYCGISKCPPSGCPECLFDFSDMTPKRRTTFIAWEKEQSERTESEGGQDVN